MVPQDPVARKLFAFAGFTSLSLLGFSALVYGLLPPSIPLFFSKPWGEEQLAQTLFIFLVPGLSIFVTIFNLFITYLLTTYWLSASLNGKKGQNTNKHLEQATLISRILAFVSFLVALLGATNIVRIVFLVI